MDFWQRLEDRLRERRMSAAELARHIGISPASVNGWKNGSYPRADAACKIASVLGTTVEYLVEGKTPHEEPQEIIELAAEIYRLPEVYRDVVFGTVETLKKDVLRRSERTELRNIG